MLFLMAGVKYLYIMKGCPRLSDIEVKMAVGFLYGKIFIEKALLKLIYYKLYEKDNVVLYVGMNYGKEQH